MKFWPISTGIRVLSGRTPSPIRQRPISYLIGVGTGSAEVAIGTGIVGVHRCARQDSDETTVGFLPDRDRISVGRRVNSSPTAAEFQPNRGQIPVGPRSILTGPRLDSGRTTAGPVRPRSDFGRTAIGFQLNPSRISAGPRSDSGRTTTEFRLDHGRILIRPQ